MGSHATLQTLSANKNQLTSLAGFTNLSCLEVLNLAENKITTLEGIRCCNSLKKLNLQANLIVSFDTMPDLPALEEINFANCPIAKIGDLAKLICYTNLNNINLTETPLAEEMGESLKKELLILLDGLKFKTINGEEVTDEDITDAKQEKADRLKAAEEARIAAEEEAKAAAEEAAKAAAEGKDE